MRIQLAPVQVLAGLSVCSLATTYAGARIVPPRQTLLQFTVVLPKRAIHNSVRGTVLDPTGATVGGSLVEIIDTQTQKAVASQTTTGSGEFHFESLPAGDHYKLEIRRDGFCPLEVPLSVLQHGGARRFKFKLVVAA